MAIGDYKVCVDCGATKTLDDFYALKGAPDGRHPRCKPCYQARRGIRGPRSSSASSTGTVTTDTGYVASRELLQVWDAVVKTGANGNYPLVLMFLGPSGCGKTVGAEYLAGSVGLPFTKVDAASMTDPESWFGTREVVARDGVSVTTYRPSTFVSSITKPGVTLIDEVNRIRDEHRNIVLPLTDGTHQVTNPLTGEIVKRDPGNFIIMSGNRGLQFTGTYAVDPALMTRSVVVEFDYMDPRSEQTLLEQRTGVDAEVAKALVALASDTRTLAKSDPDMAPVSTRELLAAADLHAKGCPLDLAVQVGIINGAPDDGGVDSIRQKVVNIWGGKRPA